MKKPLIGILMLLMAGITAGHAYGMYTYNRAFKAPRRAPARTVRPARRFTVRDTENIEKKVFVTEYVEMVAAAKELKKNDPTLKKFDALSSQICQEYQQNKNKPLWRFWETKQAYENKAWKKFSAEQQALCGIETQYKENKYLPIEEKLKQAEEIGLKLNLFKPRKSSDAVEPLMYTRHANKVPTTEFYDIVKKNGLLDEWQKTDW